MKAVSRRFLVLIFALVLGMGALWATASLADKPERAMLPSTAGVKEACPETGTGEEHWDQHQVSLEGAGTFTDIASGESTRTMVEIGRPFISKRGLKTVPLKVVSIGGAGFAEGVGETRFWLDATRPVTGGIWEKQPGTEFPAIQEMRFHFFYTVEAMPGKVYRSVNPAIMRSEDVRAFPPLPGTIYNLVRPVELEEVSEPGVVVGRVLANRVKVPGGRDLKPESGR